MNKFWNKIYINAIFIANILFLKNILNTLRILDISGCDQITDLSYLKCDPGMPGVYGISNLIIKNFYVISSDVDLNIKHSELDNQAIVNNFKN